jgi:murein L,D-transpeptidase YcbB/YkuD
LLNSSRLLQSVDLISVRRFYDAHGVDCAWSPDNAAQMLGVIAGAGDHGLDPNLFHALQIEELEGNTESMAVMTRDVLLTDAAIRYARFMSEGIGPVAEGNLDAPADRLTQTDRLGALGASLQDGAVGQWLAGLAPRYSAYALLQQGLVRYREIVATGGWEMLPTSLSRPGQTDFSALRRRLHAEGDLAADDGSPAFDAEFPVAHRLDGQRRIVARDDQAAQCFCQ